MKNINIGRIFLVAMFGILVLLGMPTYDDVHVETDAEFMARICNGMYLTSDTETIKEGMGE